MNNQSFPYSFEPQANASPAEDLGFGNKIGQDVRRLINRDGSFNVRRSGAGWRSIHPYQLLISLSWGKFLLVVTLFFMLVNALFAAAYLAVGIEHLAGTSGPEASWIDHFGEAFYFSVQTFSTVGYGAIAPRGHMANLLASFEALIGLLGFALATGVAFGRFSRPSAKINFSPHAVIAPYQDINAFEFRVVNERKNQLIGLEVQVVLSCSHWDGSMWVQKFYPIELERSKVTLFSRS